MENRWNSDLDAVAALRARRRFIQQAAAGTALAVLGGIYLLESGASAETQEKRSDGRPRLPPGQRALQALKPMGGQPGSPLRKDFRLRVSGEVEQALELDFDQLARLGATEVSADVHCVTGWSVLGARFTGVPIQALAKLARPKASARHVIFEAAHDYTANVPLQQALSPASHIVYQLGSEPLPPPHGAPVRALVPDLYFWKSPKWLTGLRFVSQDEPGFWERRGYNNHADPWREERYA